MKGHIYSLKREREKKKKWEEKNQLEPNEFDHHTQEACWKYHDETLTIPSWKVVFRQWTMLF